jgi:hypothetical protein
MNWWNEVVVGPLRDMLSEVGTKIPALVGALLVLIVGWLIARAIRTITTKALKIVRFDIAAGKAGISNALVKGGIKHTPAELIGILVYWLAMLIVFASAINALGLEAVTDLLSQILRYLPNVIAAIFVLVLGMFLANFVSGIIRTAASNAGIAQARILGDITQYIVVICAAIVALQQLEIAVDFVVTIVMLLIGAVCLAFGIAFGLGCKEIAADFMKKFLSKYTKE